MKRNLPASDGRANDEVERRAGGRRQEDQRAINLQIQGGAVLYGGLALGVVAGAALSTYLWWKRTRALNLLNMTPLERVEQLISSCESKLESIEHTFAELKAAR
ncbi:MAG: hypothetical protein M3347_03030 [Armatimonadota bacterium]|nr:hypothetical protein [Armatimonadota bacterium]